ncbi:uncharacterized protein LOC131315217 [Rhododendron vialii]|uniref:uncharacterized protein LOC131315217 n=1 Tax=Rhododendron vialii TaxID=182163 RepID=UPI00265E398D|nr:uncharacterized protein LOC131315217 [Rhododendron vialii]
MKKLYRKGKVHPSQPLISDHLTFLPATILTLAAMLSPVDREVLAYLISSSSSNFSVNQNKTQKTNTTTNTTSTGGSGKGGDHPPSFNCNCFRCYTSYWVRWDSSPNRQLIHEIIDAFEDGVAQSKRSEKSKKERRRRGFNGSGHEPNRSRVSSSKDESCLMELTSGSGGGGGGDEVEEGSVRKLMSFIGERLWSVWTLGN